MTLLLLFKFVATISDDYLAHPMSRLFFIDVAWFVLPWRWHALVSQLYRELICVKIVIRIIGDEAVITEWLHSCHISCDIFMLFLTCTVSLERIIPNKLLWWRLCATSSSLLICLNRWCCHLFWWGSLIIKLILSHVVCLLLRRHHYLLYYIWSVKI